MGESQWQVTSVVELRSKSYNSFDRIKCADMVVGSPRALLLCQSYAIGGGEEAHIFSIQQKQQSQ